LTRRLLDIRRRYGALFTQGGYEPFAMKGADAAHVIGFSRHSKQQRIVTIVGRHFAKLTDNGRHWPDQIDARLELERRGQWQNLLSGEVVSTDTLMLPVYGAA
jgi:(1->4)-alpha-D-glucan 1-alpha-D-glucosylmutase